MPEWFDDDYLSEEDVYITSRFSERGNAPEWLVNWWAMEFGDKGFVVSKEKAINRKSPSPSGVESSQNVGPSVQPDDNLECVSPSSCPHTSCPQPLSASSVAAAEARLDAARRDAESSDAERAAALRLIEQEATLGVERSPPAAPASWPPGANLHSPPLLAPPTSPSSLELGLSREACEVDLLTFLVKARQDHFGPAILEGFTSVDNEEVENEDECVDEEEDMDKEDATGAAAAAIEEKVEESSPGSVLDFHALLTQSPPPSSASFITSVSVPPITSVSAQDCSP